MNQLDKLTNTIIGVSGITAVEVVPTLPVIQTLDYSSIIQTLVQVLIGVATLIGLFKKKSI